MVEFGASIKLDATSATEQMRKFADGTTAASKTLKKFQAETRATAQGGGSNVFRGYIKSTQKANQAILKSITLMHDQKQSYSKLTDTQKSHVALADKLNRKYDESAMVERKLIEIRKELRIVTASGLKTQKEANAIFNREAAMLNRGTQAYKTKIAETKKLNAALKKQSDQLHEAEMRFSKDYAIKNKVSVAQKQLNLLLKNGSINTAQYNKLLNEQRKRIKAVVNENHKMITSQMRMAKAARLVSVYSRLLLGAYAAIRAVKMFVEFEKTAEAIKLLDQKLTFLTGDSGAYKKLFSMTQDVGMNMAAANKIITRFAVVTNRAFNIDTMAEWSSTLVQSARATGTSTQEMTGALIQITQAMSAGRLMGDEYRSVTENLPLLTVALRDMFGRSTSSLKELSSQGLLTNKVLIEAFSRTKVLLEGFPDATNTVEASLGRLSSSWDNLVSKISNTTVSKDIMNSLSEFFIGTAESIEQGQLDSTLKDTKTARKRLAMWQAELQKSILIKSSDADVITKGHADRIIEIRLKQIEQQKALIASLEEKYKVLTGTSAGDIAKKAADDKIQAIREENRVFSENQKTLELIDKLRGGKSIATIKKNETLTRNLIKQKNELHALGEAGGIADDVMADLNKTLDESTKIKIDQVIKKEIDGELRLKGFKTNINIEKIEEELKTTGKILAIKKKFAKEVLAVESSAEARVIGLKKKQAPEQLSTTTPEIAAELIAKLDAKKLKEIKDHMDSVTASINSVGNAALANTAKLKGDISATLGFDKASIVSDYDKSVISLKENMKQYGSEAEFAKLKIGTMNDVLIEQTKILADQRDALLQKKDDDFTSNLEQKFDSGASAIRAYNIEIKTLTVAKDRLNLSEEEHSRQLRLLTESMNAQVNQSKSLRNELTQNEQAIRGMDKGLQDFRNSAKTTFELISESSTTFLDGMTNSFVIGGSEGKEAFRSMTESILADLQRMIVKTLILQSLDFMGFGTPTVKTSVKPSVAPNPITQVAAKGGTFSGRGISSYSNTVVDKPTVFPFAKGVGLMGEAGEEAIMPLKRGRDGSLGIMSNGGGDTVVHVNVINNSQAEIKQETTTNENGEKVIRIMVEQAVGTMVQSGKMDKLLKPYGIQRQGGR